MKHRVDLKSPVIADIFAIRPLRLGPAGGIEPAFQNYLGIRRHQNVRGDALDDGNRHAAHPTQQREFVLRRHMAETGDAIRGV